MEENLAAPCCCPRRRDGLHDPADQRSPAGYGRSLLVIVVLPSVRATRENAFQE